MSRVHVVSFCNLIGTARARRRKSTTFPADVTRFSPPPIFEERAWGRGFKMVIAQTEALQSTLKQLSKGRITHQSIFIALLASTVD